MVHCQPASDVPVPAAWRQSMPPASPEDAGHVDAGDENYDEGMVGWESAGVSTRRVERFERPAEFRRIEVKRRPLRRARLFILLLCSVVTCTLIGWVTLI